MSKKGIIIGVIILVILAVAIPATVYLTQQQQTLKSRAQSPTTTAATDNSCQPPTAVSNVKINYPSCQGSDCSFTTASCTWDAVAGAVTYSVKVTEVDTSTVVKTDSVSGNTNIEVFPVTQGRTYQCDVSAINSCGGTGGTGSGSLLCKVDVAFASATPSATPVSSPTPPPSASPTPTPLACGAAQCNTIPCAAGLTCVQASDGQAYCAKPAFLSACSQGPSMGACCSAPAPKPTVPKLPVSGDSDNTLMLVGIGVLLMAFAAFSIKISGK